MPDDFDPSASTAVPSAPSGPMGAQDENRESPEALRRRVSTLEAENVALMTRYAEQLQADNDRMQRAMDPTRPALAAPAGASYRGEQVPGQRDRLTAVRLATDLAAVEALLDEMEAAASVGDHRKATTSKIAAVSRTCRSLKWACDDADMRQMLMTMARHHDRLVEPSGPKTPRQFRVGPEDTSFRDVEIALLELAGLARRLAEQHVDTAIEAYERNPTNAAMRMQDPALLLNDLRALRDATCQSADILAMGVRNAESRTRWRKICSFGLGGLVIVAVNAATVTVIGPVAVALSGAVGSAGVGAALPMLWPNASENPQAVGSAPA